MIGESEFVPVGVLIKNTDSKTGKSSISIEYS